MTADSYYYQPDLAWVHHSGYSHHIQRTCAGIIRLLHENGVSAGARVLDVGCGSGLLARELLAAGFEVYGVDASPAMIELAREYAPAARFAVIQLPTHRLPGAHGALPNADAVVSTGHVLNYLGSREEIRGALGELTRALRPAGVLAIDLMTPSFGDRPDLNEVHAKVEDDWAIVTRLSRPEPYRIDRMITVFRRVGDRWRRSDEYHRNVTVDVDDALRALRVNGVDAQARAGFGSETLPGGLTVLTGVRR